MPNMHCCWVCVAVHVALFGASNIHAFHATCVYMLSVVYKVHALPNEFLSVCTHAVAHSLSLCLHVRNKVWHLFIRQAWIGGFLSYITKSLQGTISSTAVSSVSQPPQLAQKLK